MWFCALDTALDGFTLPHLLRYSKFLYFLLERQTEIGERDSEKALFSPSMQLRLKACSERQFSGALSEAD